MPIAQKAVTHSMSFDWAKPSPAPILSMDEDVSHPTHRLVPQALACQTSRAKWQRVESVTSDHNRRFRLYLRCTMGSIVLRLPTADGDGSFVSELDGKSSLAVPLPTGFPQPRKGSLRSSLPGTWQRAPRVARGREACLSRRYETSQPLIR